MADVLTSLDLSLLIQTSDSYQYHRTYQSRWPTGYCPLTSDCQLGMDSISYCLLSSQRSKIDSQTGCLHQFLWSNPESQSIESRSWSTTRSSSSSIEWNQFRRRSTHLSTSPLKPSILTWNPLEGSGGCYRLVGGGSRSHPSSSCSSSQSCQPRSENPSSKSSSDCLCNLDALSWYLSSSSSYTSKVSRWLHSTPLHPSHRIWTHPQFINPTSLESNLYHDPQGIRSDSSHRWWRCTNIWSSRHSVWIKRPTRLVRLAHKHRLSSKLSRSWGQSFFNQFSILILCLIKTEHAHLDTCDGYMM